MSLDTGGNVKVDFVWGNIAPQPNTARTGDGSATVLLAANADQNNGWSGFSVKQSPALDASLGFHRMLTTSYNGFPDYTPRAPYLDEVAQATVPNVVGLTESAATTALIGAGLVKGAVTTANNAAGATSENDGKVKTQTPAAATVVNTGASVALVKYAYTAE